MLTKHIVVDLILKLELQFLVSVLEFILKDTASALVITRIDWREGLGVAHQAISL